MGRKKKIQTNEHKQEIPLLDEGNISNSDPFGIGNIQIPRLADTPSLGFNESNDTQSKQQSQGEEQQPEKRKYKTKRQRQVELEEAKLIMIPAFDFISQVMHDRGIEPLSEYEKQRGIEAWYPILEKYLPSIEAWSIWIPPALWVTTVYVARRDKKLLTKTTVDVLPLNEVKNNEVKDASITSNH